MTRTVSDKNSQIIPHVGDIARIEQIKMKPVVCNPGKWITFDSGEINHPKGTVNVKAMQGLDGPKTFEVNVNSTDPTVPILEGTEIVQGHIWYDFESDRIAVSRYEHGKTPSGVPTGSLTDYIPEAELPKGFRDVFFDFARDLMDRMKYTPPTDGVVSENAVAHKSQTSQDLPESLLSFKIEASQRFSQLGAGPVREVRKLT